MRKLLCLMSLVFLLVGCSEVSTTDETKTSEETKVEEPKESILEVGSSYQLDDIKITFDQVKESKGNKYFKPEKGKVFVGGKFTIENTSDEEQHISSLLLFDAYADDVKESISITGLTILGDSLDGEIAPGKKLVGWYTIETSKSYKNLEFHFADSLFTRDKVKFKYTKN